MLRNETVFKYKEPNARSWAHYYNESFTFEPIFLDKIKSNTSAIVHQLFSDNYTFYAQANSTCFSSAYDDNYYQCLVDIGYSGSLAAGHDSIKQRTAIASSQQQLTNAGPSITGAPSVVMVRWGQTNVFSFRVISSHTFNVTVLAAAISVQGNRSADSKNNNTVTISNDIPAVLSMNGTSGNATNVTLTWTPQTLNITGFTVTVTDSLGATASWAPVTYYCTCVSDAALCLYPNTSNTNSMSNSTNSTTNTSKCLGIYMNELIFLLLFLKNLYQLMVNS